jgi:elongation factor Ts
MPEVTAAMVKALRERTGLPLMEVKKALQETGGDEEKALEYIRKQGIKTKETRIGRETSAGRIAVYIDFAKGVGAMIELQCESAPVAGGKDFMQFANELAKHLAMGPGASSGEALLKQAMPGKSQTFGEALDDMYNRIREVFKLGRVVRIDGPCGGYAHHDGSAGALVEVKGGNQEVAKDIAMHVVAFKPAAVSKNDLDPTAVEKEREILTEAARKEGKPENIIGKMIEGRLKNFFAEKVLLEQPFVKDDKRTVGKVAEEAKMQVVRFVRWELGKE